MSVVETFPFSFFMINLLANIVISPTQMTFFLEHSCSSTSSPFELVLGFKPSIILFCYQSMLKFINTFTWVVCSIQVQILVFINYNIFILEFESKVLKPKTNLNNSLTFNVLLWCLWSSIPYSDLVTMLNFYIHFWGWRNF